MPETGSGRGIDSAKSIGLQCRHVPASRLGKGLPGVAFKPGEAADKSAGIDTPAGFRHRCDPVICDSVPFVVPAERSGPPIELSHAPILRADPERVSGGKKA